MQFLREFWAFARERRKYWIVPMLLILLAFGALIVAGVGAVAPFIYTLF